MDEFQILHTLFLTLLALFFAWHLTRRLRKNGKKKLPPSPPTLPIIGNLHQIGKLSHRTLRDLSRKHGPLMLLHLGPKQMLVVSSADAAKAVMKTHDVSFAGRVEMNVLKKVFYDVKDLIHVPYGEEWRKLKSIFMQELMSSKRVKSYRSIRDEEVSHLIEKIRDCSVSSKPVNLSSMFTTLSCDLISRAALGTKHGVIKEQYEKEIFEIIEETVSFFNNFPAGEFITWLGWTSRINGFKAAVDRYVKKKDRIMDAIVEDHLNRGNMQNLSEDHENENFVDILLGIYKGNTPGVSIDLISIKALILDTFAAGTETSSTTLIWTMTELIKNPKAMKKLQDEIREIMKGKIHITEDDLLKMRYLKAVIKETLRFHPPVAMYVHRAREEVNLMGFDIEPGIPVLINAWAIGRDPASWNEPEKFKPERFLDSPVDFKGSDFQLIPFGAGRRICPGIGFATNNIEHTLANLLHKFDWALPDGANGEDWNVAEKPGLTSGLKNPLIVTASLNSNSY